MREVVGVALLFAGAYISMLAAVSVRVLIDLLRQGPSAAEDAYARGCSLRRTGPP